MDYQHLEVGGQGPLGTITINRPDALNALSTEVLGELINAVSEFELDDAVRVVCVTGAGKAFVAGADIAEMQTLGPRQAQHFAELGAHLGHAIESSGKPYIAAVNGFALGGGCELALACDFIYASRKAKFGQPEVKLGVIPGFGGTQRLCRRVGIAKTKELVFSGDMISAEEGHRIGLVDALFAPEELDAGVQAMAVRISNTGPLAVAEAKRVIHQGASATLEQGVLMEMLAFANLFASEDQKEGMAAFVEKREASFKGA